MSNLCLAVTIDPLTVDEVSPIPLAPSIMDATDEQEFVRNANSLIERRSEDDFIVPRRHARRHIPRTEPFTAAENRFSPIDAAKDDPPSGDAAVGDPRREKSNAVSFDLRPAPPSGSGEYGAAAMPSPRSILKPCEASSCRAP